jgi:outer membrane protein TolC
MIRFTPMLLLVLLVRDAAGQGPDAERFVRAGVARAAATTDARLALARDEAALARTRGLRLPALTFIAQHVELAGGADIGALVNPAFAAINQLTGRNDLPTDLSFTFPLRQDARARLALPLFDPAIGAAVGAARAERDGRMAMADATLREVEAGLRLGLLRHAMAQEQVRVREVVLETLTEQLRVTERLAVEGLATPDVVLRARADHSEAAQRLLEAGRQVASARRAVNRVARLPLDTPLPVVSDTTFAPVVPSSLDAALMQATNRAELAGADAGVAGAAAGRRAARATSMPTVSLAADVGWQGDRWRFTGENDVQQLTVVASWTPFQSGRDARRREEARLESERASLARESLEESITLEVHEAWDALATARAALVPAAERAAAADRAWMLLRRSHAEGVATWLDLSAARTTATAAAVELVLARYAAAEAAIHLARATTPAASIFPESSR